MCVGTPDNELGAERAVAALACPLGKLVHLTSLHLRGIVPWGSGVSRVNMHVVPCRSVRGRLW